jgi:hypothetical protein
MVCSDHPNLRRLRDRRIFNCVTRSGFNFRNARATRRRRRFTGKFEDARLAAAAKCERE